MEQALFSGDEMAERLNVSKKELQNLVNKGLPHVQIGGNKKRFLLASVLEWMEAHKQAQAQAQEQRAREHERQEAAKNQILELFKTLDKARRAEVLKSLNEQEKGGFRR